MKLSPYGPMLVDRRIGSSDLYPLLMRQGLPVELTTLAYGDCAFLGRGANDEPMSIGVERKRIPDLVSSLMHGRLNGHQLPGMLDAYRFSWILVEGTYRADETGRLVVPRKGGWGPLAIGRQHFQVEGLESWLLTVALRGGARVMHTRDDEHTCRWLSALYKWWTQKAWGDHHGHLALDQAIPEHDAVMLIKPNLVQRTAAQLPGVGYERAREVKKFFPSVLSMACADLSAWKAVPGIGDTLGRRIVKLLQEGE